MLAKIAAVALLLATMPVALWAAGGLPPPHGRQDLVSVLPEPELSVEHTWRQRVGAICGWQRKQVKTLGKAFRRAATPADFQLLLESAIRLGERSTEIFKRLDAPLTYRREARTLLYLWHRENDALEEFADAAERQNGTAFAHRVRLIARLDLRISRIFARLGVDGCTRKPVTVLDEERAPVV